MKQATLLPEDRPRPELVYRWRWGWLTVRWSAVDEGKGLHKMGGCATAQTWEFGFAAGRPELENPRAIIRVRP